MEPRNYTGAASLDGFIGCNELTSWMRGVERHTQPRAVGRGCRTVRIGPIGEYNVLAACFLVRVTELWWVWPQPMGMQ